MVRALWYRIKKLHVESHFRDPKHKEVSCLCNTQWEEDRHPHLSRFESLEPTMEPTILIAPPERGTDHNWQPRCST